MNSRERWHFELNNSNVSFLICDVIFPAIPKKILIRVDNHLLYKFVLILAKIVLRF